MRKYELTIVLPGGLTAAKKKSAIEKIGKIIKTLKGKISKQDDWGEIDFAYPIKKNTAGIFLLFNLELEAESAKAISNKLKFEEEILRYLLVRKE